jgi:hypothetical protein
MRAIGLERDCGRGGGARCARSGPRLSLRLPSKVLPRLCGLPGRGTAASVVV